MILTKATNNLNSAFGAYLTSWFGVYMKAGVLISRSARGNQEIATPALC
ncbi:MAG: hypothetical protein PHO32_08820 [Candidatus Cloacimonetes bacterium]|nr:hypothetical protein [Candidatus Cloacimonadota bacterium]